MAQVCNAEGGGVCMDATKRPNPSGRAEDPEVPTAGVVLKACRAPVAPVGG